MSDFKLEIKAIEKAIEILEQTAPARIAQKRTTQEKSSNHIFYLKKAILHLREHTTK